MTANNREHPALVTTVAPSAGRLIQGIVRAGHARAAGGPDQDRRWIEAEGEPTGPRDVRQRSVDKRDAASPEGPRDQVTWRALRRIDVRRCWPGSSGGRSRW